MRDWTRIDGYLTSLEGDVYPQPTGHDEHPAFAKQVIDTWLSKLTGCNSVLDVGCGEGFAEDFFKEWNVAYEGVCLGDDYLVAKERGRNVKRMDFSFLEYPENTFDLIFSRHSLEHSPMPLLTLFEWARVTKQWLGLVLPDPSFYTYKGLNHYAVMEREQVGWLLDRAGFKVLWDDVGYISVQANKTMDNPQGMTAHEIRLFCEKKR